MSRRPHVDTAIEALVMASERWKSAALALGIVRQARTTTPGPTAMIRDHPGAIDGGRAKAFELIGEAFELAVYHDFELAAVWARVLKDNVRQDTEASKALRGQ